MFFSFCLACVCSCVTASDLLNTTCLLLRYAVILAFDVRIEREAQEMADNLGVRVFSADIIYHLFDKFTAYREVR